MDHSTSSPTVRADFDQDGSTTPTTDLTSTNPSDPVPTLLPSPRNLSIEHIFFSLQQMEARITNIENDHNETKEQITAIQQQVPQFVTVQDIDHRFGQLRTQMLTLQRAQQALHAQFQEVAACFHQVSCQWQELQNNTETMQQLADQQPPTPASSSTSRR